MLIVERLGLVTLWEGQSVENNGSLQVNFLVVFTSAFKKASPSVRKFCRNNPVGNNMLKLTVETLEQGVKYVQN